MDVIHYRFGSTKCHKLNHYGLHLKASSLSEFRVFIKQCKYPDGQLFQLLLAGHVVMTECIMSGLHSYDTHHSYYIEHNFKSKCFNVILNVN